MSEIQPTLFDITPPARDKILLSLMPQYASALTIGAKRYEYRRGRFVNRPVDAFIYATTEKSSADRGLPSSCIVALARLGMPLVGTEEVVSVKLGEDPDSEQEMRAWLTGFSTASAHPIEEVLRLETPISLSEIREQVPSFHPPQRYILLDRNPALLDFIMNRSGIGLE